LAPLQHDLVNAFEKCAAKESQVRSAICVSYLQFIFENIFLQILAVLNFRFFYQRMQFFGFRFENNSNVRLISIKKMFMN
jgi:hypothetical protein